MKQLTIEQFIQHVNNTITDILNMEQEEQYNFCNDNPISVTFNGVTCNIFNNADSITSLLELAQNGL